MVCGWSCGYFGIQQLTEDVKQNNKVGYFIFFALLIQVARQFQMNSANVLPD
jgi:hypothetical protein